MKLNQQEKKSFLADLEAMPDFLVEAFANLPKSVLTLSGPNESFCPVEHVWHLADLEQQGFALRIRRLQAEDNPQLPDFDGDSVAREGNYKARSFDEGIATFRAARGDNIATLRGLSDPEWFNAGEQEGVGSVSLCDIPAMMAEHDEAHRMEIADWLSLRKSELSEER